MLKSIPPIAWILMSSSGFILSVGVSIQAFRSSELSIKFANFQLDSSVQLSKNLKLTNDLERQANLLKERENAFELLTNKYKQLEKYNQPITMLEPEIKEVNRLEKKVDLEVISEELEETTSQIVAEIQKIEETKAETK